MATNHSNSQSEVSLAEWLRRLTRNQFRSRAEVRIL
ncbi:hypothetical protein PENARI_c002G03969 [Penicillium arizonense]|uniref:Uncharacterized protein n=1 Tax=Penicillium arizonense TaxID=1835702 RepID=A0A1F5LUV4_PENAI|nr:hypothetical protein PENARI_c002G03969 [Penicillium arizonense]OGE56957.1 hypothetical protein PENARI_c002G03969 [Penicillium arizonense]